MNKPEQEIILMVLDKKVGTNGKEFYSGFLGFNSIYANEYNGKLYVKLQKWAKKEKSDAPVQDDPNTFKPTEEDAPF